MVQSHWFHFLSVKRIIITKINKNIKAAAATGASFLACSANLITTGNFSVIFEGNSSMKFMMLVDGVRVVFFVGVVGIFEGLNGGRSNVILALLFSTTPL